jgi:hypothetical protein
MRDRKPTNTDDVQGEGDYRSARRYKKDIDEFIAKKGKDIPDMAKKAEHDLESGEGPELEKAEAKGKAKARH